MDKDVLHSKIENKRKYYDGLKHSVELSKQEREVAFWIYKTLNSLDKFSVQIEEGERVYTSIKNGVAVSFSIPLCVPDDKVLLDQFYLAIKVIHPIQRFFDYITKNREIKDRFLTEVKDRLNSYALNEEYDNIIAYGENKSIENIRILEEIRFEDEKTEVAKDQIREWAQHRIDYFMHTDPHPFLSAVEGCFEFIISLKHKDNIQTLESALLPYEMDILKGIIDNEQVNQHVNFIVVSKNGQELYESIVNNDTQTIDSILPPNEKDNLINNIRKRVEKLVIEDEKLNQSKFIRSVIGHENEDSCQETNKLKVNESGLEKNDGKYFSLPDDFYDLKIDFKHSSEYFNGPKFVLSADTIDSFTNLINYIADNNYIDNSIEIKRTLVYRLTGRWRPEGELKTIYWNDHRKYPLSLVYLVCYGFDPTEDKYDRMMEFFEVSQWLDRSEFSHRAIGAPKNFRMKLHELFPDVFKINENEESLQKKPKFL